MENPPCPPEFAPDSRIAAAASSAAAVGGVTDRLTFIPSPHVVPMRQSHDDDAAVLRYGTSMSRTLSARRLHDGSSGSESSLQAASSFSDLPLLALPGLASRVSIAGTSASQNDLRAFFDTAVADGHIEVDAMTVEGGLTPSLVLSTAGALASSLMFGLNNANMNTPAAAMRASLGLPSSLPAGCAAGEAVHAQLLENDVTWSLIVSILCLGALVGSASAAYLADGWGRRAFLLHNSGLYAVAALVGAAASAFPADAFPAGASPAGGREEDPCSTSRSTAAILLLLLSRVLSGVACGGSTVVVPMYLGEISPTTGRRCQRAATQHEPSGWPRRDLARPPARHARLRLPPHRRHRRAPLAQALAHTVTSHPSWCDHFVRHAPRASARPSSPPRLRRPARFLLLPRLPARPSRPRVRAGGGWFSSPSSLPPHCRYSSSALPCSSRLAGSSCAGATRPREPPSQGCAAAAAARSRPPSCTKSWPRCSPPRKAGPEAGDRQAQAGQAARGARWLIDPGVLLCTSTQYSLGGGSSARLLIDPSARRPLVLCVGLMAVQQFSGPCPRRFLEGS